MDNFHFRSEVYLNKKEPYNLFSCYVLNAGSVKDSLFETGGFITDNVYGYSARLWIYDNGIEFTFETDCNSNLNCEVKIFIGSKKMLCSKRISTPRYEKDESKYYHDLITLPADECFSELQQHPKDTLTIINRMKLPKTEIFWFSVIGTPFDTSTSAAKKSLKKLADGFRNCSESLFKEEVQLQVGEETETVNKAVLCTRSPVFAKMFENHMREKNENRVTITDIKMPVIKEIISYLYTNKIADYEFDFLCEYCCAADKYLISDLRETCIDLLTELICENVLPILQIAFDHDWERLKSSSMAYFVGHIGDVVFSKDWRNFVDNGQKIVVEIAEFLDF